MSHQSLTLHPPGGPAIAGVEAGPADGPAVILLAGWPQTLHAWRHMLPRLAAAGWRVIALDPPGLGDSDPLPAGHAYDTATVADVLAAAVASLGVETYAVVGHDVGAWIAYAWAVRHPRAVSRLCVAEGAIPGIMPDAAFGIANAARVFQFYFHAVEGLPEVLTEGREHLYFDWFFNAKTRVPSAISPADRAIYAASYRRPGRMSAGFAYYRAVPVSSAQNRAATLPPMPILALGGEASVGGSLHRGLLAQDAVPGAKVSGHVMPGVGHFLPEEDPEGFAVVVLPFLDGAEG
ncbi:MAG: alpha/beta hydrolase [Azospirillaceae bacterium]|nr:alpha/beta hydrolase [Azospirillaceae bacterium]